MYQGRGGSCNPPCASSATGSVIGKLATDCVTNVIQFGNDLTAIVIRFLTTTKDKDAQKDNASDDSERCRFDVRMKITAIELANNQTSIVGLLNRVGQKVQNPKHRTHGEDFRTDSVNLGAVGNNSLNRVCQSFNSGQSGNGESHFQGVAGGM